AQHPHLARLMQRALLEETSTVQDLIARWLSPLYREGVAIISRAAASSGWERDEVPHLTLGLFGLVFSYFVNTGGLRRLGAWGPGPGGARRARRAAAVPREVHLPPAGPATGRGKSHDTTKELPWLTSPGPGPGSRTRASPKCAPVSDRDSPAAAAGAPR